MKNFIFSSQRQEKKFKAFKSGVETALNLRDKKLYKSEINRINQIILFCVRKAPSTNKENIKITAGIVKKFLDASNEIRKDREKGNNSLFGAKVFMLFKSILKPPKTSVKGKKRSIILTEEEINFLHRAKNK